MRCGEFLEAGRSIIFGSGPDGKPGCRQVGRALSAEFAGKRKVPERIDCGKSNHYSTVKILAYRLQMKYSMAVAACFQAVPEPHNYTTFPNHKSIYPTGATGKLSQYCY
jgi:hypothetical protein